MAEKTEHYTNTARIRKKPRGVTIDPVTEIKKGVKCKVTVNKNVIKNAIQGSVHIISAKDLTINHAYIEIYGVASCEWSLEKPKKKEAELHRLPKQKRNKKIAQGTEKFYFARHTLCGGDITHRHNNKKPYEFKCYWPPRLPGTWFGDFGSIRYTAAVIIRTGEEVYTHTQQIIVKTYRDLALEEHLFFESRVDTSRNFFTGRNLGSVYISVWVPINGVAAGQSLPVVCTIVNHSRIQFGSLIFVLTKLDIFKSSTPKTHVKIVRTDICRVPKLVNIFKGKYDFYATLTISSDTAPTNQFFSCSCCQTIYELWVSLQAVYPRYTTLGYPNIDTKAIPIIIGTTPLLEYNINKITANIMKNLFEYSYQLEVEQVAVDEEVKKIITEGEEEINRQIITNLGRTIGVNDDEK